MNIKNLSLGAAMAAFLPFALISCGSDTCRTCDCDILESVTRNYNDGSSESESETSSRSFTACDSDVNNPNEPSWEYWEANPTVVYEESDSDYDVEYTRDYNCNCEED